MKSSDRNNIIVNQLPPAHAKNPGWEFYPSSQLKQLVEQDKRKQLQTPPSIKIRTIEIKANFKDLRKPRHIFKAQDPKLLGKQKREVLDNWIKEENDLRKGIQKPKRPIKEPPKQKVEIQNEEWPDLKESQYDEQTADEQVSDSKLDNAKDIVGDQEEENNDEQQDQDLQDQEPLDEEQNDPDEQQESQIQDNDAENNDDNNISEEQPEPEEQEPMNDNQEVKSIEEDQEYANDYEEEQQEQSQKSQVMSNHSEVQSVASKSFVNQQQQTSKSQISSSVFGYKSQTADKMRELMDAFE